MGYFSVSTNNSIEFWNGFVYIFHILNNAASFSHGYTQIHLLKRCKNEIILYVLHEKKNYFVNLY